MKFRFARLLPMGAITRAAMLTFVASAVLAVPASAQSDASNEVVSTGGLLATQFTRGRNWRLATNLDTTADSNFLYLPDDQAQSAIRITPTIEAGAGLPVGRQQFFVSALIGRDFYINNAFFNRNRWQAGAGMAWRLGARCNGIIGAETQEQLLRVNELAEFTANVQTLNTAAASANCETATGLGFGASVRRQSASNDTPRFEVFDYRDTTFSPRITYGNPSLGQFSLGASISNVSFPKRPVLSVDGFAEDGLSSFNGRLGYSRNLGSRLQLTFGLSYLRTQPKPSTILTIDPVGQIVAVPRDPFSGTGFDVSIAYQATPRLGIRVAGDRSINTSQFVGALYTLTQGISVDLAYAIGPSLDFAIGAQRRTNDYRESFLAPDDPQVRLNDRFDRVFAKLDYAPVSLYSIGVEVAHQRRVSNPSTFDFRGTTALLRLRVKLGRG